MESVGTSGFNLSKKRNKIFEFLKKKQFVPNMEESLTCIDNKVFAERNDGSFL